MKINDAIIYLKRNEAWHVVKEEYFEKIIESKTREAMQPVDDQNQVFARERAKAAAAVLKQVLAHFESTVHASEEDDDDATD